MARLSGCPASPATYPRSGALGVPHVAENLMEKSRSTKERPVAALRDAEARSAKVAARERGVSEQSIYGAK